MPRVFITCVTCQIHVERKGVVWKDSGGGGGGGELSWCLLLCVCMYWVWEKQLVVMSKPGIIS